MVEGAFSSMGKPIEHNRLTLVKVVLHQQFAFPRYKAHTYTICRQNSLNDIKASLPYKYKEQRGSPNEDFSHFSPNFFLFLN